MCVQREELRADPSKLLTALSSSNSSLLVLRACYAEITQARPRGSFDCFQLPVPITKLIEMLRVVSQTAADRGCPAIDCEESIKATRSGVAAAQANVRAAAAAAETITDTALQSKVSARDLARSNHARALRLARSKLLTAAGIASDGSAMDTLQALKLSCVELETCTEEARRLIADEAARESIAVKLAAVHAVQPGSTNVGRKVLPAHSAEATARSFLTVLDKWMQSVSLPDLHSRTDSAYQELRSTVLRIID